MYICMVRNEVIFCCPCIEGRGEYFTWGTKANFWIVCILHLYHLVFFTEHLFYSLALLIPNVYDTPLALVMQSTLLAALFQSFV